MEWNEERRPAAAGRRGVRCASDRRFQHEFQQNLTDLPLAVVVLVAHSNDVDVLKPLMPQVRDLLPIVEHGRLYHIGPAD